MLTRKAPGREDSRMSEFIKRRFYLKQVQVDELSQSSISTEERLNRRDLRDVGRETQDKNLRD